MTRKASDSARGVPCRRCSAPRNQAGAGPSNTQRLSTSRLSAARTPLRVAACVFSAAPCDHQGFKLIDERRGCNSLSSWATPDHIFVAARIILCSAADFNARECAFPLLAVWLCKKASTGVWEERTDGHRKSPPAPASTRIAGERRPSCGGAGAGQPRGAHAAPRPRLAQRPRRRRRRARLSTAQTSASATRHPFGLLALVDVVADRLAGECALSGVVPLSGRTGGCPRFAASTRAGVFRTAYRITLDL